MEESFKRLRVDKIDFTNEKEVLELANNQEYIQPVRKLLNRPILEIYDLLPGSEVIILNELHRRCTEKSKFRPQVRKDAFYFDMRANMSENAVEMYESTMIRKRLKCQELERQQIIIRHLLKENIILIEKLLNWKFHFFSDFKLDKKRAFKFNTLFKYFIMRRKEIHNLLTDINNHIAEIIIRANESEVYLKRSIRLLSSDLEN
ncbi:hypothetical protein M153_15316000616 [Pseudoloma neurophilia]|uniref:Uncharacterized protein n=1 Tax=Pseudoloma neurophilia TaxID=146866 RepID=A0A0R0LR86_9MICR|nr:hypothetical protein M153_15316000616 [Pseudoloma neurophilia]